MCVCFCVCGVGGVDDGNETCGCTESKQSLEANGEKSASVAKIFNANKEKGGVIQPLKECH